MNQLSWLLYWAEVLGNVQAFGWVVFAGLLMFAAILGIVGSVERENASGRDSDRWKAGLALQRRAPKAVVVAAVLGAVLCLVPSKNTLMLIAASQVGETVLASEDVQQIGGEAGALATDSIKLLRQYISEQLAKAPEPAPK